MYSGKQITKLTLAVIRAGVASVRAKNNLDYCG